MQFQLHREYVRAATQRSRAQERARARARGAEPPPGRLRASAARALAGTARRLDRESARRVLA